MTPLELYEAEKMLANTYRAQGDWRGAIAALEDARTRATELGLHSRAEICDCILAHIEIHVRQEAKDQGITVEELGNLEPMS